MNKKEELQKIINSDSFGLLAKKEALPLKESKSDKQRLIDSFQEITNFYEQNHRLPSNEEDITELKLLSRLNAIKKDPNKVRLLLDFDFYNLLDKGKTPSISLPNSLEDPLGLLNLSDEDDSIFDLQHVERNGRLSPDFIAHRRICHDFDEYQPLFEQIKQDLKTKRRHFVQFSEDDLNSKNCFVLGGVLLLLVKADTKVAEYGFSSGQRVRQDGRTRCIFDNGTESEMLFRSLGKALLKNGFTISEAVDVKSDSSTPITKDDRSNGFIYVLKSKSKDPQIMAFKDLYKIGYCTTTINERVADAKNDPTYLMADVQLLLSVKCFNLSVPNLEDTIHKFFGSVNIEFKIQGNDGVVHYPREWFAVPLPIVEEAIQLIINNEIDNYYYDDKVMAIIQKGKPIE
jgi:hypothetical protein